MRFFAPLSVLATLVAAAVAQTSSGANPFNIPQGGYQLTAGKAQTFSWKPTTSGTVTLTLRDGSSNNLNSGTVIASKVDNSGSYSYTPPSNIVRGSSYTIQITSDSDPSQVNYTPQFVIDSSNTVASQSGSASASASASASSGSAASSAASTSAASSASKASASSGSSAASATASSTGSMMSMSSMSASATKSGSSSAASSAGAATTKSSQTAPTNAVGRLQVQGGLAAVVAGGVAVLL